MVTRKITAMRSLSLTRFSLPGVVLVVYIALFALYFEILHPWMMTWGATSAEQSMALPGDELPPGPDTYYTRAITINAPPAVVWPWIVQIGQDRAGFYSNDWLENFFGADIHNANAIHSEWQRLAVGDTVPMGDAWAAGPATLLHIRAIDPGRMITDIPGRFVLIPIEDHGTRLLLREPPFVPNAQGATLAAVELTWDPMHFVMEQRMLRGIKERAEGQPLIPSAVLLAARVGWVLAGLGLLGLFVTRRHGYLWLLIPLAFAVPQLVVTDDPNAALAGFLAVGITVAGALVFGPRWWSAYALIAAGVALVLLLAPDAYVAFGLTFDLILGIVLVAAYRGRGGKTTASQEPTRIAA